MKHEVRTYTTLAREISVGDKVWNDGRWWIVSDIDDSPEDSCNPNCMHVYVWTPNTDATRDFVIYAMNPNDRILCLGNGIVVA